MRTTTAMAAFLAVAGVTGCAVPEPPTEEGAADLPFSDAPSPGVVGGAPGSAGAPVPATARAELIDATGESVGTVLFSTDPSDGSAGVRVHLSVRLSDLSPGPKGFHIHEGSSCVAPDFGSAGDHFDPHGAPHGGPTDPPSSRHLGDLGNVPLNEVGLIEHTLQDRLITLGAGPNGVVGRVVILHEGEDDVVTQPSGDAGDPVACGVIESNG